LEVPVGTYEIEVNQTGFKKYLRKGIALDLNQIVSVDIALQVGTASEVIEVTGAPPLVDTTPPSLEQSWENAPSANCLWLSAIPISYWSCNQEFRASSASTMSMAATALA
jgi:hypothetical protein